MLDFVMDYGIPINIEGKPNWSELREKFYGKYTYYEAKSVNLLEKLIQEFRSISQQVIFKANYANLNGIEDTSSFKMTPLSISNGLEGGLQIDPELADKFYFNLNLLKFIRKTILFNSEQTWKAHYDDLVEELSTRLGEESHPAYLPQAVFPAGQADKRLLLHAAQHGISGLRSFLLSGDDGDCREAGEALAPKLWFRVKAVCEFFKGQEERSCVKKKKGDKGLGFGTVSNGILGTSGLGGAGPAGAGYGVGAGPGAEGAKKKLKNNIATDEAGNIIYPIVISSSLRLVAPGSKLGI
jgi:hypothetical protein